MTIDRIKALTKEKGISLSFICGKLGLARNYLSEVKNGKAKLTDDRLAIIADILNTTPEYLKGETDEKEKPADLVVSEQDKEAMDLYSRLTPEQKALVRAQMKGILSNQ